jgi:hypothetical protein
LFILKNKSYYQAICAKFYTDFDVDGYGVTHGEHFTQRVIGWNSKDVRIAFSTRIQRFLSGGILSISIGSTVVKDFFTVEG